MSAYGEMHGLDGDIEGVTTTSLLFGGEGEFLVEPFKTRSQVHGGEGIISHYVLYFFNLYE